MNPFNPILLPVLLREDEETRRDRRQENEKEGKREDWNEL